MQMQTDERVLFCCCKTPIEVKPLDGGITPCALSQFSAASTVSVPVVRCRAVRRGGRRG